MPTVQATAYPIVSDITNLVRGNLNDYNANVWPDLPNTQTNSPGLILFLNAGYRALQRKFSTKGLLRMKQDDYEVQIPAATFGPNESIQTLTYEGNPALPADLITPVRLWEAQLNVGSPLLDYKDMWFVNGQFPSGAQPAQYLRWWRWANDQIEFVGAVDALMVKIQYMSILAPLLTSSDTVEISDSTDALAAYTSWRAANSKGAPNAAEFKAEYDELSDDLVDREVLAKQNYGRRRRPYNHRRRGRCRAL